MTNIAQDERRVPKTIAVPAGLKELMERAQAMFPKFIEGKVAEVDPELVALRDYANWAIEQWEAQLGAVNLQLQMQMGDAEKGAVNGQVVIKRLQYPVKGHYVEPGVRDYLKTAKK